MKVALNTISITPIFHHFPIETERWYGIDHNNRLCNICTDTEIGDEFHFILECKSVANKRELYLITHFKSRMSTLTFCQLRQIENKP